MIHVFLDANILLNLHGLRPQEVAELEKLRLLIDEGELTLWLPEIVADEYERNRPRVVAEALKSLREARLTVKSPELAYGLPEQEQLQEAVRDVNRAHSALLQVLEDAVGDRALPADSVVAALFEAARRIPTEPLLSAARQRRELRRPPGKATSIGDAISWEALLSAVPDGEDLHLVSTDPDFRSPLNTGRLDEYLEAEWREKKSSNATLYTDLASFLKEHFAAVRFPSDIPKLRLIQQLADSPNFESTHSLIADLSRFDVFTPEQAELIVRNCSK